MISEQTESILRKLLAEQPTYRPVQEILEQLRHISFVCFVGATCMGKTTLMDALAAFDPKYGKTRNFTTREPRPDDDPKRYYYYEHSDAGLQPVLERIERHENLQHNINPFNLHMYGSEIGDYPHQYNMGDIFSSSIDGFRQLGFGKLYVFSVVTDADTWQQRFEERFPAGHPQREARLQEAVVSLEWSLAQIDDDHAWIVNPPDHIESAVGAVDDIILGDKPQRQEEAKQSAVACLQRAKDMPA